MRNKAKQRAKKIMRFKKSNIQIHRKKIEIFRKLQQVIKESRNDDQISQDYTLPHINSKNQQALPKGDCMCRCKHLLEIPNMFPTYHNKRISSYIEQHKVELSFIQTIIWLKSVTACVPQIPVEKLQQLFDKQCNMRINNNYYENEHIEDVYVESPLTTLVNKTPIHERLNNSEEFITPSVKNIFNSSCNVISPMIYKSYTDPEDIQSEMFSFASSSKDRDESVAELSKQEPETSTSNVMTNQEKRKEFVSKSYIIPDLDEDALSKMNELFEESDDMQEHQNFEHEEISSNNSNKRIDNEIIEDENIICSTSTNNADISDEHRSVSLTRCQSIESIFNLKYNSDDECITLITPMTISPNDVIGKMKTSDYSPTNFTNCNINFSQSSLVSCMTPCEQNNINNFQIDRVQSKTLYDYNDDNFEYQINNSLSTSISDTATEKQDQDSAYSTLKLETFNYNTAKITKTIIADKRISDTNIGHYYNLRPRKKREEVTGSPSLIQKPVYRKLSARKHPLSKKYKSESAKDLSKEISHDYNDNFEYQINNSLSTSMSDTAIEKQEHDSAYNTLKLETLNYNIAITTKPIITNKRISDANIGHHYNLRPRKKREEITGSPLLIQKPVCRKLSARKHPSSKKCKSEPAKNLSREKKRNKDEVISANWLDFTVEMLNSEHVILASIKVILLTLCDKRTAQEYAIHRCWKDSLEEQAVNAILNIVDIFKIEKKPDICTKKIEKMIVETLDEMMTSLQLNETFIWIYRIQIILKFCHLLPICVKTINYLIAMLETFQHVLINAANDNERTTEIEINQLYLISYTLDMALRTYRVLIPRDNKSQPVENAIPCIAHLWKTRYEIKNEELENASFDPDTIEKEWTNALQKFTVTSVKHLALVQFADVSFSLYHILIST